MKKHFNLLFVLALLCSFTVLAQSPQGFNYQAVARDGSGVLLKNTSITIKAIILSGASASNIEYEETHSVTTNDYGLFSVVVGEGSSSQNFSNIEWGSNKHHLKVELSQGAGFVVMGTVQLQSVPYALHSKTAETATSATTAETATNVTNVNVSSSDISDISSVGANTGNVLKWNGTAWVPGIDDNTTTTYAAGTGVEINSTTISAKNTDALWNANKLDGKNVDASNPGSDQFLKWDGQNWVAADQQTYTAGTGLVLDNNEFKASNDIAIWNADKLLGISLPSGAPATDQILKYDGTSWAYAADNSGSGGSGGSTPWTTSGSDIYYTSATGNVGINNANPFSRLSVRDSFISTANGVYYLQDNYYYSGQGSGARYITQRNVNIASGGVSNIAALNVTGGAALSTGECMGTWSQAVGTGDFNIASFNQTGEDASSQSIANYNDARANSTFNIGVYANADKANTNSNYGLFAIGDSATTSYAAYFVGDVNYTGTLTNVSDRKLKYDVKPLTGATNILNQLQPKSYLYKQDGEAGYLNLSEGKQFGFIAQELEEVVPELVREQVQPKGFKKDGQVEYKAVNYMGLIPILTQALKEQQELIEQLEKRITELENK